MNAAGPPRRVLLLVVCAAPPARQIDQLIVLLQEDGWDVCVITTPAAADWIDTQRLTTLTGHPVWTDVRRPDEAKSLPRADALAVVPATFNTINKWASGMNDTLALGVLNEAVGGDLPIVASSYAKSALASHPAFDRSLDFLRRAGVTFTETEAIRPPSDDQPFLWSIVIDVLRTAISHHNDS